MEMDRKRLKTLSDARMQALYLTCVGFDTGIVWWGGGLVYVSYEARNCRDRDDCRR